MDIGNKYSYRKDLGFIATEGAGSTYPGDPYLYRFPENYSNFLFSLLFVLVQLEDI